MPGRILTLQRQVRELGRLRAGLTETGVSKDGKEYQRPTSSKTWILTAANRDYLDAATQLWGGDVHEWQPVGNGPKAWRLITNTALIDAILPPGDPLSQHQEMWSRGGCQRRCDGEQEMLSGNPCLCRAQFGDDFHEQKQGSVCDIHTRLNVFLPDLPDIGVWRVETKGFWPANHIAGYVDMIKGQVGPQVLVPIRLRIEPRTKVRAGKTSQYIEIVVELRSQATFAQILEAPNVLAIGGTADTRVIEGTPARAAIESAAPPSQNVNNGPQLTPSAVWRQRFGQAKTRDELRSMWTRAGNDGALDDEETRAAYKVAAEALLSKAPPSATATENADWGERIKAAAEEDMPAIWEAIVAAKADNDVKQLWWAKKRQLKAGDGPTSVAADGVVEHEATVVEGEPEPDLDEAWTKVLTLAGKQGWNSAETTRRMVATVGKSPEDADGWDFDTFAQAIQSGQVAA